MTPAASIESLELAVRDYLYLVLETQDRIMAAIVDLRAEQAELKATLDALAGAVEEHVLHPLHTLPAMTDSEITASVAPT